MMEDHEEDYGRGQRKQGGNPSPARLRVRPMTTVDAEKRSTSVEVGRMDSMGSADSEDSDDAEEESITSSTMEAAFAAKQSIERFYKNFFRSLQDRVHRYVYSEMMHLKGEKLLFDQLVCRREIQFLSL